MRIARCTIYFKGLDESSRPFFLQGDNKVIKNVLNKQQNLVIGNEIKQALQNKMPIVALESTIITYGMPYPNNVGTARMVEQNVRDNGAIPATIAIINGKLKVGLNDDDLELMGRGENIKKVSRRDLPYVVANGLNGATTVATTMIIANMVGIKVFATGGIGGVHRGAQETFDISADLTELANTDVAVVCAGAKSILDIGPTLEYLETKGVPVLGYKTENFPGFYISNSGFKVDYHVNSPEEIAHILKIKWEMNLKGGVVIANPIPEQFEMNAREIDKAINLALEEAKEKKISGKQLTPFLLSKIANLTGGNSLESNIQLVINNAIVAAQIAQEFCCH